MSLAAAQERLLPEPPIPEEMPDGVGRPGLALSGALHVGLLAVLILGLPTLFHPPPVEEMPIAVQLVNLAPETRATHPNPNPRSEAKPEPPAEAPVAKPEPKPEPPQPAPPPPSAAAPPAPTEPPPRPVEEKPEAAPPPPPKPAEVKPEPPPPPPDKLLTARPKEKPLPPQPTPKTEAKVEQKRYDPSQFANLLKNLATQQTAPSPDAPPQRRQTASAAPPSSQPRAPLGSQLSASELDMVREQIARCWNVPAGARDAKDLVVVIRVVVNPDGTVQKATIVDQARAASDPFFRAAAESARRAFFNPQCRPLHLPPEKYAIWKDLVVDFSPKDIL
jgi:outer membrane biosynthesis protein TonB